MDRPSPWFKARLAAIVRADRAPETVRRYRGAVLRTDRALTEAGRSPDPARWTPRGARSDVRHEVERFSRQLVEGKEPPES